MRSYINSIWSIIITAVLGLAGFYGCTTDVAGPVPGNGGEEAIVKLSIYTPSAAVPKATRSSATEDECIVQRIKVVVLEYQGGQYRYSYMVDGHQIVQDAENAQLSTFSARLVSSDVPLKLLLVANHNDAFVPSPLTAGMSESQVISLINDSFIDQMTGNLPMYGEVKVSELNAESTTTITGVTMLRAVARVDVNNMIDTDFSESFDIQEVYVYRANNKLRLIPDPAAMNSDSFSVFSPTVPSDAQNVYGVYTRTVPSGETGVTGMYVPEAVSTAEADFGETTCVVVGGLYGSDTEPSYYRIDFNSGLDGHPFGQILRNYKYIFNVVQVNSRGWENPDEAAKYASSSIVTEIQIWNEVTSEMYLCGQGNFLGISSREVTLDYKKGSEQVLYLQTGLSFRLQPTDSQGNPTGPEVSGLGGEMPNEFFKVTMLADDSGREETYRLVITALADNHSGGIYTGYFKVVTNLWSFDVTVHQLDYASMFRNRDINVLTITSLPGDLGFSDGTFTDGLSSVAMRRVLENKDNFSPSGTMPVKGIIMHNFSNEKLSSSDTEFMAILEKMLGHIDVVHLPKNCSPSVAASSLIYNWLRASDHTVLIMGMDNEQTNANMRDYFDEDGDWYTTLQVKDLVLAELDWEDPPRNAMAIKGPFGVPDVDEWEEIGMAVQELGYNNGYGPDCVPILRADDTAGGDVAYMLTHGINLDLGLLYFGQSEVFSHLGTAMSLQAHNTGTVKTDFDIVMANVWAWICDRVVLGK